MAEFDCLIVGCGFAGSVIARFLAEEKGKKVLIIERRNHIAGNMYDRVDENGILYQLYGPHTFHTNKKEIFDYLKCFCEWYEFHVTCMAQINGKFTPSPFNFQTIDDFFPSDKANLIKEQLLLAYPGKSKAPIVELLNHSNPLIKEYAQFLFDKDYSLYTAKQWGVSPNEIDISVLNRVPVLFSYEKGYFDDAYQYMPRGGFTKLFEKIVAHRNIEIQLNVDAKDVISIDGDNRCVCVYRKHFDGPVVYTGMLDSLLDYKYGVLPYRSLMFQFETKQIKSFQDAPIVAYPQADKYTRITEFTKMPPQDNSVTKIAIEYPLQYDSSKSSEPYYPIITETNLATYALYKSDAENIRNLFLCGRLADYKYYNMDQVLERSLFVCKLISERKNYK